MDKMSWEEIWNHKVCNTDIMTFSKDRVLSELLKINGFDSKSGVFDLEKYLIFIKKLCKKIGIIDIKSIFEVGCGSGAFLFALLNIRGGGDIMKLGGIDYSKSLIEYSKMVFNGYKDNFSFQKANELGVDDRYDLICSFSVFHYFQDLFYARDVLEKMILKAVKRVLILDVLDINKKAEDIALKKKLYGKDYEKMYGALPHLYYSKDFFLQVAQEFGLSCEIWDQEIEGYQNSDFRFNVLINKE